MNSGRSVKTIVLLVLAAALIVVGVLGIMAVIEERNSQPTEFELYTSESEERVAQAKAYMEAVDVARGNIEGYKAQIEENIAALETAMEDPAYIQAAIAKQEGNQANEDAYKAAMASFIEGLRASINKVDDELAKVDASKTKIETTLMDALNKFLGLTEETDEKEVANARSKMRNATNLMLTELKKITKVTQFENTKSSETVVREECEKTAAKIADAYPDVDLGEQFVVMKDASDAAENVKVAKSLREILMENWDYCFWLAGALILFAGLQVLSDKNPAVYKNIIQGSKKNMMLVALVLITLIFFALTRYKLLLPVNVSNVINQNAYIIILACGMLMCIICSANIDLSVGRVMGFIGACAAKFMIEGKMPFYLAVPLCLLIGIAIGAWQGFWIAYMRIPAFVVTLAGQLIFYGLTMMILQGLTINKFPAEFSAMFNTYVPDFIGPMLGITGFNVTTMLIGVLVVAAFIVIQLTGRATRIRKGYPVGSLGAMWIKIGIISAVLLWLFYSMAAASGLPTVLFTVAIVLLIYLFITSRTVIGRHLYAMGGNVNAARLSGVKTQKMLFLAYVNMGMLAALAGLVYAARLDAASPQAGAGDELYAIASCYIGGASAYGGIGTVGGALIGALTMGVIKNGMSIMSLGQDIQQIVLGMVLLTAVVIDVVSKANGTALPFLSRFGAKKEKKSG